jgi:hypothetical protein
VTGRAEGHHLDRPSQFGALGQGLKLAAHHSRAAHRAPDGRLVQDHPELRAVVPANLSKKLFGATAGHQ